MDTDENAMLAEEIRRLEQAREEEKQRAVKEALGKFNFFIHLTGFISGCAYLVIMGILFPPALPFIFIPIGLWTIGFSYHGYRAFRPRRDKPAEAAGRADS
ncbi:MAG: 2TM domain-containing protein [Actinobacteria bacterium]|nr:2TM domain-containing protein [Actinomycetota bacterium]MCG2819104.1 2TM domain-containing protein [Actinomycetes bacterium]MBU4178367.1 2TM domain-containing protein [Actinomycetota bacterium]MBU4218711.1 2TM domain-containing protein [Actinomycetota bacterium]MBU4359440.1 2TM domain-containing protein [Actinomycetota bacterium]